MTQRFVKMHLNMNLLATAILISLLTLLLGKSYFAAAFQPVTHR